MVTLRGGKVAGSWSQVECRGTARMSLKPVARKRLRAVIRKAARLTQVGKAAKIAQVAKKVTVAVPPARKVNKEAVRRNLMNKFHMEQPVVDIIISTILTSLPKVNFEEIIGQDEAVKSLRQQVVYPALNPDVGG
jgi:hypothetical protein